MNTVKLLVITKSHSNRPQVFYLIGPGRTVNEVLSCCSPELRSISSNHKAVEWLRTQDPGWSALCCFWHPQRQTFSSKRLTDKKSLAGLYSPPWAPGGKGPTQRISKNYITADLSTHAFLARSHDGPILIEAVGSEIHLNSSAVLRRGCNNLGINRDFSKARQTFNALVLHHWATETITLLFCL